MNRRRKILTALVIACMAMMVHYAFFLLRDPIFKDPYSTILEDHEGTLLGATIAPDGQWRFPAASDIPEKFKTALIEFEDRRFNSHPGVDPFALARAVVQNVKRGSIVSGGSTLSMQVIRLSRKGQARTYAEKVWEMLIATRLELRYTKSEILSLYAAHAPFGGNVVGMESACWRYFGRQPEDLSWAEAALLAVLPNNPSLLHPGKNRDLLKAKRDRLLRKLRDAGHLDAPSLDLALEEPIPEKPMALPQFASHLLARAIADGHAQTRVVTTVDQRLQVRTMEILANHYERMRGNQIHNAAALILDVHTGHVLAYVGNTKSGADNQEDVDVIAAPRSTGSILKPFLFAAMLDEGKMLSKTLMPDIPTTINGFSPRNFSHTYDGTVPADKALIRSLNIPAVHALRDFRYEKFYGLLKQLGLTTLTQPADHYGLSLILGGAEGTLWDITGAYASMARTLDNHVQFTGRNSVPVCDIFGPSYLKQPTHVPGDYNACSLPLSASSIWLTFETLRDLYRPGEETGWRYFSSSKRIAWKTGTSFGFRDGWAVGVNPDFAVGVWVGNADGEGRPGLVGTETAAPILFDLFAQLPGQPWFQQPVDEMESLVACTRSGQRATALCAAGDTIWVTRAGLQTSPCQYHKLVHLSRDARTRVNTACANMSDIQTQPWFVLPPVQEYYYKKRNLNYRSLPPYRSDCPDPSTIASMDLIYPKPNSKIYLPRDLTGAAGLAVFQVAHRSSMATVYWHLDGNFIGSTRVPHQMILAPDEGNHILTVMDEQGQYLDRPFKVLSRN